MGILLILFLGCLLFCLGVGVVGHVVFGSLDRAARRSRAAMRFTLIDFLALMFLLQLPMGVVHYFLGAEAGPAVVMLDGFGWFATGMLWFFGVRALCRAGVVNPRHRGLFFFFVAPTGLVATLGIPICGCYIIAVLLDQPPSPRPLIWLLLAFTGLVWLASIDRWLIRFILHHPPTSAEAQASEIL